MKISGVPVHIRVSFSVSGKRSYLNELDDSDFYANVDLANIIEAETVLLVEKDKGNSDISHVSAMHIRAMDFEPFALDRKSVV